MDMDTGAEVNIFPLVSYSMANKASKAMVDEPQKFFPILVDEQGNFEIFNAGTASTPCVVSITPKMDNMVLTIEGLSDEPINYLKLKGGEALVIDGENKTVTINGKDAFANYDAWEFPKVKPGNNKIKISNAVQHFIAINFKPRFI